ncbi:universal stress protein [Mesonia sp.]|uniref:universal stress protein n=1 Tax=Mesonia sp. TaxID=1960830 RepID=UPI003F978D4D
MTGSNANSIYDSIAGTNKKMLDELNNELSKKYKSEAYTFHSLVDYDDFISGVEQAIELHSINLTVIGTNGATGAKEVIFGSNTLQLIRSVNCPVLTVPENYSFSSIKNMLFSIQKSNDPFATKVDIIKNMLKMHPCNLKVLELSGNITTSLDREDSETIKALFPNQAYEYYFLNTDLGLTAINTATQLLKIDLHAVYSEKETFIKRLLYGSEVSRLSYDTLVPLLFL